jgi:hypothetical protein
VLSPVSLFKSHLPRRFTRAAVSFGIPALCSALLLTYGTPAHAQIRGRPPVGQASGPSEGWWFSGGVAGLVMGGINDGASGKRWEFGSDPLWQLRGTLEKALDQATTLGVSAGYGVVDVNVSRLQGSGVVDPLPGTNTVCIDVCAAEIETWQLMGQFRSGGGPGFHTFFEAQGGVNGFRNLRTKDTGEAFGSTKLQMDLAGSLGFGFGYTLSPGMVIGLVQDFGIGWHAKDDLPQGTSRTYRTRATRASLRFKF